MSRPIKSRDGLTRCRACRAHIRAGERPSDTVCPFCGASLRTGRPLISLPSGRGGILAASLLAFGAGACGGSDGDAPSQTPVTAEPASAGENDPPAGGPSSENTNEPTDDPSYDEPNDPVAVEAYGAPPEDDPAADEPDEPLEQDDDDDRFRPEPADRPRPAPRYGLAPSPRRPPDRAPRNDDSNP